MRKFNRVAKQRFRRALFELQSRNGWSAQQLASNFHLPYRTVSSWLAGKSSPGVRRLKGLCRVFGWQYEVLFQRESLADELFERQHLDLGALTQRFLSLQSRDPLEAWSFASVAGALLFNELSASGFECRAIIDHRFGVRIEFMLPALREVVLHVGVVSGRGFIIRWLNVQRVEQEERVLSDSTLEAIKLNLRSMAGFQPER
jgi:transcriptional regulator with XRE-family HTH domain